MARLKTGQHYPLEIREKLRDDAIRLQREGLNHGQIAEALGVPRKWVDNSLAAYNKSVRLDHDRRRLAELSRHTEVLGRLLEDVVAQWERSKKDAESVKVTDPSEVVVKGEIRPVAGKVERTTKGQHGDPGLIREARGILADIRSMWGLDAPRRVDVTSGGKSVGAPVRFVEVVPPDGIEETEADPHAPPE